MQSVARAGDEKPGLAAGVFGVENTHRLFLVVFSGMIPPFEQIHLTFFGD
ncbi:hypothetical protein M4578_07330 [Salipiger sp. P9]|nr:hypothetical protein [Salipiger pentaromativorans]